MFGDYAYGGATVLSLVKLDAPAVANRMEIGEKEKREVCLQKGARGWWLCSGPVRFGWFVLNFEILPRHLVRCRVG